MSVIEASERYGVAKKYWHRVHIVYLRYLNTDSPCKQQLLELWGYELTKAQVAKTMAFQELEDAVKHSSN